MKQRMKNKILDIVLNSFIAVTLGTVMIVGTLGILKALGLL